MSENNQIKNKYKGWINTYRYEDVELLKNMGIKLDGSIKHSDGSIEYDCEMDLVQFVRIHDYAHLFQWNLTSYNRQGSFNYKN